MSDNGTQHHEEDRPMCTRSDYPPFATDAREDAVCPEHGPNLYTCPDGCAFAAAFGHDDCDHGCLLGDPECPKRPKAHPGATLTGGTIPAHVPGAYPSLSCCGGSVQLVDDRPAHEGPAEPIVPEGPGWAGWGPNFDDTADAAFATVYLEPRSAESGTATVAELWITVAPHVSGATNSEAGAELTGYDLAALAIRACELGAIAATDTGRHFRAEAFDRAREQLERITA